jgi:hypothetical protein
MDRKVVTKNKHGEVIRVVESTEPFARRVFYAKIIARVSAIIFVIGFLAGSALTWVFTHR